MFYYVKDVITGKNLVSPTRNQFAYGVPYKWTNVEKPTAFVNRYLMEGKTVSVGMATAEEWQANFLDKKGQLAPSKSERVKREVKATPVREKTIKETVMESRASKGYVPKKPTSVVVETFAGNWENTNATCLQCKKGCKQSADATVHCELFEQKKV